MLKQHPRLFVTTLMLGDLILTATAFGLALYVRFYFGPFQFYFLPPTSEALTLLAILAPLALIFFTFFGFYDTRRTESIFSDLPAIFNTSVCLMLVLSAFIYFYREIKFSRLTIVLFGIIFFVLLFSERVLLRLVIKYMRSLGFNTKRLLIVGAGDLGLRVLRAVQNNPSYGYCVVGLLDDYVTNGYFKKDYDVEVLGRAEEIVDVVDTHEIDKVIIALPIKAISKTSKLVERCEAAGIEAEIVPDFLKFIKRHTVLRNLDGLPLLSVSSLPIRSWAYAGFKRCVDIVFSLLLLLASSPLMAISALLIKLSSPGPVFFMQERVGINGKRFRIIKFRTMRSDAEEVLTRRLAEDEKLRAEWRANFKLKKDPRITGIGAFLRKTSLDELPQLFNVLSGEMSLVGPRPLPRYHQQELSPHVSTLRTRALPGMTGLWQISGRSDVGIRAMELWDLYYVQNWSMWLDFTILLRTVPVVFKGIGAF